jgi:hypothetical protein
MTIDWFAFVQVFAAALTAAVLVVGFYALGLRLLVRAGRPPVVAPVEFTDAITVITERRPAVPRRRRRRRPSAAPSPRGRSVSRSSARTCASRCAPQPCWAVCS